MPPDLTSLRQEVVCAAVAADEAQLRRMRLACNVQPGPLNFRDFGDRHVLAIREAAKYCNHSERTHWALTAPRGPIPAIRTGMAGRKLLYDIADLDAYLASRKVKSSEENGPQDGRSASRQPKGITV